MQECPAPGELLLLCSLHVPPSLHACSTVCLSLVPLSDAYFAFAVPSVKRKSSQQAVFVTGILHLPHAMPLMKACALGSAPAQKSGVRGNLALSSPLL